MTVFSIAVLPGDGIGPEVTAEAVKVLRRVEDKLGGKAAQRESYRQAERESRAGKCQTLPNRPAGRAPSATRMPISRVTGDPAPEPKGDPPAIL